MSLIGKIAVITGSSKGIGFAMAKEFAENNGAIVIVCSRKKEQAARAVAQINGKAFAAELDVTDDLRVKRFIQQEQQLCALIKSSYSGYATKY